MMSLEGKRVVVIGGGPVAERKIMGLLETGALISVISPELGQRLQELAIEDRIDWIAEHFHPSLLDRFKEIALIFGATDNNKDGYEHQEGRDPVPKHEMSSK